MALLYYCSGLYLCFDGQMNQLRILISRKRKTENLKLFALCLCVAVVSLLALAGCDVQRRKSDAELGLNPQQIAGRRIYDNYCDRCHAPYSSRGRQGPSMKGIFQRPYLPMSGMPANDDRVTDIVRLGRNKMPGYAQVLSQQQISDLLAYLHTL
jgi:mono/diheme cytochrome c family protein